MQGSIFADRREALRQAREQLLSDPQAAAAQARALVESDPGDVSALRVLGRALRLADRPADAATAEREAIALSIRLPGHVAAARALQSGNLTEAVAQLRQLLAEDEGDVMALTMMGLQASNAREFEFAEPVLRRAVELAPAEPAPRMALAEMLHHSRRSALALAELDALDSHAAESEQARSLRAEIFSVLGRTEEELAILLPLSEAAPDPLHYGLRIGHALRTLGRGDEAIAAYREITETFPWEGTAWWSLANLKTFRFEPSDVAAMEQALTRSDVPVQNHIRLNFALGRAYEQGKSADSAFRHYAEGNRLRTTIAPYDASEIGAWVDRSVHLFTTQFFADRAGQGAPQRDPIFIVGMHRSGSTLVEQILASHPAVEGTAELNDMPNIARRLGELAAGANRTFEQYLAALPAEQLAALGQGYLDSSRVHRLTDRPEFTDKMPNNWMYLGIIRSILPNARIVDVRRDPMDCCFSNWKQLYARGLDHSNSLETMGHFYAEYVRLMRHFDSAQPGMVHRVIYEDVVEDLEGEVRRLLDYLGLPFDPACLDFHSNRRSVRTISAGQVRQPINREGIDQWKPFEQWLGPLKDALGDTLDDWRD